jgi:hypothetical protein
MLNNDEKLQEKINGFLRRKEVKYPELTNTQSEKGISKDAYKQTRNVQWTLSASNHS